MNARNEDHNQGATNEALDVPARRRTRIDDIPVAGAEMSEEDLRLVSGGLPSARTPASCTNWCGFPDVDCMYGV